MRSLLVDADPDYAEITACMLRLDSLEVVTCGTAAEAARVAGNETFDLIVLDAKLPDASGFDLCVHLKKSLPDVPVVFVSSLKRSADVDSGLTAADDYVTKPYDPPDLAARIQRLLHKSGLSLSTPSALRPVGRIEVNTVERRAYFAGIDLGCTAIELDLLSALIQYAGAVVSYAFLNERVWGYKDFDDSALLKNHVLHLRRKIARAGGGPSMIRTVYKAGYSINTKEPE